ncbi:MAG: HU family DNA-binding protein [Clostridia bacterium]|nr:HU family DNA-binding protein [Clostridia bacterium]
MNKAELVEAIAEKTGLSKRDSEKALAAVVDTVVATLAKGEKVQLVGFGTFETRVHKERTNINPATKEKQVIPATTVPAFKPGKAFKDAVK